MSYSQDFCTQNHLTCTSESTSLTLKTGHDERKSANAGGRIYHSEFNIAWSILIKEYFIYTHTHPISMI